MRNTFVYMIGLFIFTLNLTGCAGAILAGGAAAGAGTYAYINGELRTTEKASLDRLWKASLQAMDSLELNVTNKDKDALTARIKATGSNDKDIYINMKSLSRISSELRIRVGLLGDKVLSERIHDEITKNL